MRIPGTPAGNFNPDRTSNYRLTPSGYLTFSTESEVGNSELIFVGAKGDLRRLDAIESNLSKLYTVLNSTSSSDTDALFNNYLRLSGGTLTGPLVISGTLTATTVVAALTGNASTATTLQTARTIAIAGDGTGSASFNGSANVTISLTLGTVASAGTYNSVVVNAKGLVTSGSSIAYLTAEADTLATVTGRGATTTSAMVITNATGSTSTTTGALRVTGGVGVGGTLWAAAFSGPLLGNATTASSLATARTIAISGDGSGSVSFNGSANATIALTLANVSTAGTYNSVVVNAKGLVTSGSSVAYLTAETDTLASVTGRGATTGAALSITNATGATSTSTGALVVTGGVGVGGTIWASAFSGPVLGNATTATTLETARTIAIAGDAAGSTSFNGSSNATISLTLADSGVVSGTYSKVVVDAKGRVTASTTMTASDITTALGGTPIYTDGGTIATGTLSFGSSTTRQMLNLYSTTYGFGVQSNTLCARTANRFSVHRGGVHSSTANDPGSGGITIFSVDTTGAVFSGPITAGNTFVNAPVIAGATTGNPVSLTATGSDSNVGIALVPKGTGVVTAPTAGVDTNTQQVATTAFVIGQAASLVPVVNAVSAAAGTSLRYARADHVHPRDMIDPVFVGSVEMPPGTSTKPPIRLRKGTSTTSPVAGGVEWDETNLFVSTATFSRASTAIAFSYNGLLRTFANNERRYRYDQSLEYNAIPNPWGDGGTTPTGWGSMSGASVVSRGVEDGIPYVDVYITGSTTEAKYIHYYNGSDGMAAIGGDTVYSSVRLKLVSGTLTNVSNWGIEFVELAADGVTVTASGVGSFDPPTSSSLSTQTISRGRTNSGTGTVRTIARLRYDVAGAHDFTLRIGFPTFTKHATSSIDSRVSLAKLTDRVNGIPTYGLISWDPIVEVAATNSQPSSEAFTDTTYGWANPTSGTIVDNVAVAPNGTLTAARFDEGTLNAAHYISTKSALSVVNGTFYTFSVFVKPETCPYIQILGTSSAFTVNAWANFNLLTGSPGTMGSAATPKIESIGNGWYRCSLTVQAANTTATAFFIVYTANGPSWGRSPIHTGTNRTYQIWGAQFEIGSVPSSYFATGTTAATRSADNYAITRRTVAYTESSSFGTIVAESVIAGSTFANNIVLSGSTTTNPVTISATGADSNVGIRLISKGNGRVSLSGTAELKAGSNTSPPMLMSGADKLVTPVAGAIEWNETNLFATQNILSRDSKATRFDHRGYLVDVEPNVRRYTHDPSLEYNRILNPWMDGAAPSVMPTGWLLGSAFSSVTFSVVGTGTRNVSGVEIPYIRINVSGTSVGSQFGTVFCNLSNTVAAVMGDVFTSSFYLQVARIGASNTASIDMRIGCRGYDTAGTTLTDNGVSSVSSSITFADGPVSVTRTMSSSSTAQAMAQVIIGNASGYVHDWDFDIGFPTLTKNATHILNRVPLATLMARLDGEPVYGGSWFQETTESTNYVKNPRWEGASAPSTFPTNFNTFLANSNGITREVVGTGIEDGLPYIDIRVYGTATALHESTIRPIGTTEVPSVAGANWTSSVYARFISGSYTGFTIRHVILELNSAGSQLAATDSFFVPGSGEIRKQRYAATRTFTNVATAYVLPMIAFRVNNGSSVDFVIRLAGYQVENLGEATSLILPLPGVYGATTRKADVFTAVRKAIAYTDSNITGKAAGLSTGRTISLSGDSTGSVSFDGTTNATITTTLANSGVTAGTYSFATIVVDTKGRVLAATAGTSGAEADTLSTVTGRGATTGTALSITNTTASTSKTTGALVVSGGLGVGGAVVSDSVKLPSANGSAEFVTVRASTTNATVTAMTLDGAAAGAGNQIILVNNSSKFIKAMVVARNTSTGAISAWELTFAARRGATAATIALPGGIYTGIEKNRIVYDSAASAWDVNPSLDTVNGAVQISVTGAASTTINWTAQVTVIEVM